MLYEREAEVLNDVLSSPSVVGLGKAALEGLVVDIKAGAGRARWCAGAAPCALPTPHLYWRHMQCVLGPRAVAALQGIWPADSRGLGAWCEDEHRSRVVADMAGNAFTSVVCVAVSFAVFLAIPGWVEDSGGGGRSSGLDRSRVTRGESTCPAAPAA